MTLLLLLLTTLLQQPSGSIAGVVVNARSEPLAGVAVVLTAPAKMLTTTTAADGKFSFSNLTPGPYFLNTTLAGYLPAEHFSNIALTGDQQLTGLQLRMMPTGVLSGRVLSTNGEPASRAQVRAQRLSFTDAIPSLQTIQAVLTNDLGEYRLFWLPPGQYYVSATLSDPRQATLPVLISPPEVEPATFTGPALLSNMVVHSGPGSTFGPLVTSRSGSEGTSIEEGYVPVFYPGTTNIQAASRIEVQPGTQTGGLDITATPSRVFRVRGSVIDESTGKPVRPDNLSIVPRTLADARAEPSPGAITANGFEFTGIAPGSYLLVASLARPTPDLNPLTARMMGKVAIEVGDRNLENVAVVLRRPFTLSGRMTLDRPTAPAPPGGRGAQFVLSSDDAVSAPTGASMVVGPDGSFAVPVLAGTYKVFTRYVGGYVKSIRLGPDDGLLDRIHLDGPPQGTLEIVVGTNPGHLTGTVLNDRRGPVYNATVVLVPDPRYRWRPDFYVVASSDSSGKFQMQAVPPGNYKVFAWEGVERGAWFDPEFMRVQETRGMPVSFVEGSKEDVELRSISAP